MKRARAVLVAAVLGIAILGTGGAPACGDPPNPTIESFTLEHGLTVLLRPIAGSSSTALVVSFSHGGARDGLAHLVEHVYVTAAAGKAPARTAEAWMKAHPLGTNAQTGDQCTIVATVFAPEALAAEIEDAAARMGDLKPTQADLDREVPRIRQEIANMYGGLPGHAAVNYARKQVYSDDAPGGDPEAIAKAIAKASVAEVVDRWHDHYRPGNAFLAIAGALDVAAARSLVERAFGRVPPRSVTPRGYPIIGDGVPPNTTPRVKRIEIEPLSPGARPRIGLDLWASSPVRLADLAARLMLAARMWSRMPAEFGPVTEFPPPVLYAPLDGFDDLCLSRALKDGEDPEGAAYALASFAKAAASPAPTAADVTLTTETFGLLMGVADLPDSALAQNPYGVALGLARRRQMGIDPVRLRQEIAGLTAQALHAAVVMYDGYVLDSAVLVVPKRK